MKKLQQILKALKGKKTNIVAVCMAINELLSVFNVIPKEQANAINKLLLALLGMALRDGMKTEAEKHNDKN